MVLGGTLINNISAVELSGISFFLSVSCHSELFCTNNFELVLGKLSKYHQIYTRVFSEQKIYLPEYAQNLFEIQASCTSKISNCSLTLFHPILLKLTYISHQLPPFSPNYAQHLYTIFITWINLPETKKSYTNAAYDACDI